MENMAAEFGHGPIDHFAEKTKILNSWKEIAVYMSRGVRTVQRWEQDLGLPVRRPHAKARSSVIALPAEIDEWLRERPSRPAKPLKPRSTFSADQEHSEALRKESKQLVLAVRESRVQLRAVVLALSQTMMQIRATRAGATSVIPPSNLTTLHNVGLRD